MVKIFVSRAENLKYYIIILFMGVDMVPERIAENIALQLQEGKIPTMTEAIKSVGYAAPPLSLKASNNFKKTILEYLPFDWLAKKQKAQTESWNLKTIHLSEENELEDIEALCKEHDFILVEANKRKRDDWKVLIKIPDWDHRDKALDKLYKILGVYSAEKHELVKPLEDMSDEELLKIVNEGNTQPKAEIVDVKPVENTFGQ